MKRQNHKKGLKTTKSQNKYRKTAHKDSQKRQTAYENDKDLQIRMDRLLGYIVLPSPLNFLRKYIHDNGKNKGKMVIRIDHPAMMNDIWYSDLRGFSLGPGIVCW